MYGDLLKLYIKRFYSLHAKKFTVPTLSLNFVPIAVIVSGRMGIYPKSLKGN